MSINFSVSQNFESTDFRALADSIAKGSENVVNTDYQVVQKPTWGDYITNFFASLFSCCCAPKNLDYDLGRIFVKIENDIQNSLSNYIQEMAQNPGVNSTNVEGELQCIKEAISVLNQNDESQFNLNKGTITLPNRKGEIRLEKLAKKPENPVSKEALDMAVKVAFNAHRKAISERKNLSMDQKIFVNLQEGQYEINQYKKIKKDDTWMLEVTFTTSVFGGSRTACCSLQEFPHDLLNLPGDSVFDSFQKSEMIEDLQARETAYEIQLKQPEINHKEKFQQKVQDLRGKVEPLILALIQRLTKAPTQRDNSNGSTRGNDSLLRLKWSHLMDQLEQDGFTAVANEVNEKSHRQKFDLTSFDFRNPKHDMLSNWSGKNYMEIYGDAKKAKYLEPVADFKELKSTFQNGDQNSLSGAL
ncbi:MAG: hypothetical protein H0T62_10520 [Parachlamydiaceae bacterium]|nr:hypothetical protein [Parachlamydiaceae bacterium]